MVNLNGITKSLGPMMSKAKFMLNAKKPQILMSCGIVAAGASTVLACKATVKAIDVKKDADEKIDICNELIEHPENVVEGAEYTQEDHDTDVKNIKIKTGVAFAKLYAPAIVAGAVALACTLGSHGIMMRRCSALTAVATASKQALDRSKEEVAKRYGEDEANDIFNGIEEVVSQETITTKKGKTKTIEKKSKQVNPDKMSPYSRIFDETNINWVNDPSHNFVFLKHIQNWANDVLESRGYIYLNDIYKELGCDLSTAGQVLGWFKDPDNPRKIDFGIYVNDDIRKQEFLNGNEPSIILTFNVDDEPLDAKLVKKGYMRRV